MSDQDDSSEMNALLNSSGSGSATEPQKEQQLRVGAFSESESRNYFTSRTKGARGRSTSPLRPGAVADLTDLTTTAAGVGGSTRSNNNRGSTIEDTIESLEQEFAVDFENLQSEFMDMSSGKGGRGSSASSPPPPGVEVNGAAGTSPQGGSSTTVAVGAFQSTESRGSYMNRKGKGGRRRTTTPPPSGAAGVGAGAPAVGGGDPPGGGTAAATSQVGAFHEKESRESHMNRMGKGKRRMMTPATINTTNNNAAEDDDDDDSSSSKDGKPPPVGASWKNARAQVVGCSKVVEARRKFLQKKGITTTTKGGGRREPPTNNNTNDSGGVGTVPTNAEPSQKAVRRSLSHDSTASSFDGSSYPETSAERVVSSGENARAQVVGCSRAIEARRKFLERRGISPPPPNNSSANNVSSGSGIVGAVSTNAEPPRKSIRRSYSRDAPASLEGTVSTVTEPTGTVRADRSRRHIQPGVDGSFDGSSDSWRKRQMRSSTGARHEFYEKRKNGGSSSKRQSVNTTGDTSPSMNLQPLEGGEQLFVGLRENNNHDDSGSKNNEKKSGNKGVIEIEDNSSYSANPPTKSQTEYDIEDQNTRSVSQFPTEEEEEEKQEEALLSEQLSCATRSQEMEELKSERGFTDEPPGEFLATATLVEEGSARNNNGLTDGNITTGTLVAAQPVNEKRNRLIMCGMVIGAVVLGSLATALALVATSGGGSGSKNMSTTPPETTPPTIPNATSTAAPSTGTPSPSPSSSHNNIFSHPVSDFLPSYTLETIRNNSSSPQAYAFEWAKTHRKLSDPTVPVWKKQQAYALATLYYSTSKGVDPVLTTTRAWTDDAKGNWLNTKINDCEWSKKLQCDDRGQRLTKIELIESNLEGQLPPEVSLISSLTTLDVNNNFLTGRIPSEVGLLKNLTYLSFLNNNLTGTIPPALFGITSLERLSLGINKLTGGLPTELGLLTSMTFLGVIRTGLKVLQLRDNGLNSAIPSEAGLLTSLRELNIKGNDIDGVLPSELGNMTSMEMIDLSKNKLSGRIPEQIGMLSNLQELYLAGNKLSGRIPEELGMLSNLEQLILPGNELSGRIPEELGMLSNLQGLNLKDNLLRGAVPSALCELPSLQDVAVDTYRVETCPLTAFLPSYSVEAIRDNATSPQAMALAWVEEHVDPSSPIWKKQQVYGLVTLYHSTGGPNWADEAKERWLDPSVSECEWPAVDTNCTEEGKIQTLSLVKWNLVGNIPPELFLLSSMSRMIIGSNKLSGQIPTELGIATQLTQLSFFGNKLKGNLPSEFFLLTSLTSLNLARQNLNGNLPTQFGLIQSLTVLGLHNNDFGGWIPSELG